MEFDRNAADLVWKIEKSRSEKETLNAEGKPSNKVNPKRFLLFLQDSDALADRSKRVEV